MMLIKQPPMLKMMHAGLPITWPIELSLVGFTASTESPVYHP
jgi:hypothetical protein